MTNNASHCQEPPGQNVVAEAAQLLQGLSFDTDTGALREGEQVLVSVSAEPLEDQVRVLITCYAYGHRRVDWSPLRLGLKPPDRQDCFWLLPLLNQRGQSSIQGLAPAHYAVVLLRGKQPTSLQVPTLARERQSVRTRGTVRTRGPVEQPEELTVLLTSLEDHRLRIEIRTANPHWAGQPVEFRLLAQATGAVLVQEQVILTPRPNVAEWWGIWEGSVDPRQAFQFTYRILSEKGHGEET